MYTTDTNYHFMVDVVDQYLDEKKIRANLSQISLDVRRRYLNQLCRLIPSGSLNNCSVQEMRMALAQFRDTHAQNTFRQLCIYLVDLFKVLEYSQEYIRPVKEMMPSAVKNTKKAGDMLTAGDVEKLIHAAGNDRNRAMIAVMYEGGLRPVEIQYMAWDDVKFDQYGAILTTNKKTGKQRYIRLISSAPALDQWRLSSRRESGPVFVHMRNGVMQDQAIGPRGILYTVKSAADRAGIDSKRVYSYLLRHTRVTHMMEDNVPDNVIKLQHWGTVTTPMLGTYGHISNTHIDQVLLEHAGVEQHEKKGRASLQPIQCPSCRFVNLPGSRRCAHCFKAFTEDAMTEDEIVASIFSDPDRMIKVAMEIKRRQDKIG